VCGSGDLLLWSVGVAADPAWLIDIELEYAGHHHDSLRTISVLEHGKFKRLGAIDKQTAAKPAFVLHHPMTTPVLADTEERLLGALAGAGGSMFFMR